MVTDWGIVPQHSVYTGFPAYQMVTHGVRGKDTDSQHDTFGRHSWDSHLSAKHYSGLQSFQLDRVFWYNYFVTWEDEKAVFQSSWLWVSTRSYSSWVFCHPTAYLVKYSGFLPHVRCPPAQHYFWLPPTLYSVSLLPSILSPSCKLFFNLLAQQSCMIFVSLSYSILPASVNIFCTQLPSKLYLSQF